MASHKADSMAVAEVSVKGTKKTARRGTILKPSERRRLSGETLFEERTILRWERGETVLDTTRLALENAARKLGYPIPERTRGKA
jgi:hypothetical protein